MKLFKKNREHSQNKTAETADGQEMEERRLPCMPPLCAAWFSAQQPFCRQRPDCRGQQPVNFIFGLIKAVGMLCSASASCEVGLSLKSRPVPEGANGFLTLAGGVVITFAKERF